MNHILSSILLAIGAVFVCLVFYALSKRRNLLAALFSIVCVTMSIYTIAYALELLADNLQTVKFYMTLEYFGFSFFPVLWLTLAYRFYFNKAMSVRLIIIISIIPFCTMFLHSTNDYHNMYNKSIKLIENNGSFLAIMERGVIYYIFAAYAYICSAIGSYIFFISWKQSNYNVKTQSFWLFFGSVWPLAAGTVYFLNLGPKGYDLLPFSFFTLGIAYFVILFKYDFLELREIVRGYAFSQINEGIFVIDEKNRITDFNNSGQRTFNWLNSRNKGKSILSFEEGKKIMSNLSPFFEIEINNEGGRKYYEFRVTALVEKGETVGRIFLFQDITEQKLAIDRLNYIATYDTFTEVYNRNKLMEEIEKAIYDVKRHGINFSVLMIDIDYFKSINDKFGHIVGDMVIKNVAQGCKSRLQNGEIIGRYGGEEFIVILRKADIEQAVAVAEDMRMYISELNMDLKNHSIKTTISIGVVSVCENNKNITPNELINQVDNALYDAKNRGRNKVSSLCAKIRQT